MRYCWWVLLWLARAPATTVDETFERFDADHNGLLTLPEFKAAFQSAQEPPPQISAAGSFHSVPLPKRLVAGGASPPRISTTTNEDTGFYKAFVNSLGMIWATEVGDKTFFIAAVLAMRNSRFLVFSGAITALAVMTVLSAALGYALPSLLPRKYTHYASAALFLYFGLRLLRDASKMSGDGPSEELVEVEEELTHKKDAEDDPESGKSHDKGKKSQGGQGSSNSSSATSAIRVFSQACALTFLAEWGDRSQIATIALAAAKDPYGVILGGITGHAMCTGLAVLGGRMLASKISEKTVAVVGGILFLIFSIYALVFEQVPDDSSSPSFSSDGLLAKGGGLRAGLAVGASSIDSMLMPVGGGEGGASSSVVS